MPTISSGAIRAYISVLIDGPADSRVNLRILSCKVADLFGCLKPEKLAVAIVFSRSIRDVVKMLKVRLRDEHVVHLHGTRGPIPCG